MDQLLDGSAAAAVLTPPAQGQGGTPAGAVLPSAPETRPAAWSAPVTGTEQMLAAVWGELLGVERVSALDTFFRLGGDSLLATRMGFEVRRALKVALPTDVLFEPYTLRRLAGWIDERRRGAAEADGPPPLRPAPRTGPPPLTLLQEFHWMRNQMDPDATSGNMPYALRLGGALDVGALQRALTEVVRRHESLRTTFDAPRGVPVQVVAEPAPVHIPCTDLSSRPAAEREGEAMRLAAAEAARPFDLRRGPLLRALLLRLDARDWVLLVTVHHIVSDGWSMDVMVREVGALYGAFSRGVAPALPEPEVQYGDYAVWQRGWLTGEVLDRYAAWWRERLAGARPVDLAGEGEGPGRLSPRRAHEFTLAADLTAAIRRMGVQEGATPYMVLLAAFKVLLVRYTGQADVVVQTPLGGRRQPELASAIGFFAQMALLRTDLSGDPAFRDVLGRVRQSTLGAYDHQELPLVERLGPGVARETAAYQRLWRMGFTLEDTGAEPVALGDLAVTGLGSPDRSPGRMETLVLAASGDVLRGTFVYRVELFPEARVVQAMDHYAEILRQVAADPALRVSDLKLSTPA